MSNIFSSMGFDDPTFEVLRRGISEHAKHESANPSSYYGFMMISSVLSRYIGQKFNSSSQISEGEFRKELNKLRSEYSGKQKEFEIAFTRKYQDAALHHELKLVKQQTKNMQNLQAFSEFCKTWNKIFCININTIIKQIQNSSLEDLNRPKLVIARTPLTESFFSDTKLSSGNKYKSFCEAFNRKYGFLNEMDMQWITMWQYDSARRCISPKSDAYMLHFIMQGLPSIVIFPIQKNEKFIIQLATWSFGTTENNFYFNKMYEIPLANVEEINMDFSLDAIAIIAAFAADCYSTFYCNRAATSLKMLQNRGVSNPCLKELLETQISKYKDSHLFFKNMGLISL